MPIQNLNSTVDSTQLNASPMSKQTYRVCLCFRRRFKMAAPEAPADIKNIFHQYSENGVMSVDQMQRFLVEVQGEENTTLEDAQAAMDSLHKHLNIFHKRGLNLEGFFKHLFGDINTPLNPKPAVHHDMNAPMSHYFIYTGHNSYLTGNQLCSNCSDVPIAKALRNGVRVIELDIWPNLTKDNINVKHGWTLTKPVKLIKCLRSIKKHAFAEFEYPVVITLEDHLAKDLQATTAKMITQTFGDMLFSPGPECLNELQSPESLKKRVIISTKPPKELQANDAKIQESESKKGKNLAKDDDKVCSPIPCFYFISSKKGKNLAKDEPWGSELKSFKDKIVEDKDAELDGEGDEEDEDSEEDPKSQQNAAPEYWRLIAIHAGKGKGGMKDWLRVDPDKVRRLSLSEQELERAIINYSKDIVRFTQKNLLRVYPKGIRVNSSNYNPMIGWMHGAQMVAFNMQGYGRSLWLMHGMFKANGGCGYVKKPDLLLKAGSEVFDPKVALPVRTTLRVTIYMGEGWYYDFKHTHFDAYSPPDFYARVGIAGVPADAVMNRTGIIKDNWIPTWDMRFEFPLTVPELALLRIEVHEYDVPEKDGFGGQTCLPVSELRKGIRAVPLYSREGEMYNSVKLLMRFEFI